MTWTETDKNSSVWAKNSGKIKKVYRGVVGELSRGEIALAIHGAADATVTRKDMENHYGIIAENKLAACAINICALM